MKPGLRLIDGWRRAAECPATFHVPSLVELAVRVKPGVCVKLGVEGFEVPGRTLNAERFWVRVTDNSSPPLCGLVEQSDMILSEFHGVEHGDTIFFDPKHILAIHDSDT